MVPFLPSIRASCACTAALNHGFIVNLAVTRKRFNQYRSSRSSAKPAPLIPSSRPRCSTPMRIHVGRSRFANAVGDGGCAGGGAVCAADGVDDEASAAIRKRNAARMFMPQLLSNTSAIARFAETLTKREGRGQRAEGREENKSDGNVHLRHSRRLLCRFVF